MALVASVGMGGELLEVLGSPRRELSLRLAFEETSSRGPAKGFPRQIPLADSFAKMSWGDV